MALRFSSECHAGRVVGRRPEHIHVLCAETALIICSKKLNMFAAYHELFKMCGSKIASQRIIRAANRRNRNSMQVIIFVAYRKLKLFCAEKQDCELLET